MKLRNAHRLQARIKLAIQGPSGSGKTYSSLLLAFGLVGDWSKVAVIDTEHSSSDLYAHLGNFRVLPMAAPYSPERYMEAIETCEKEGVECIIIDSISHCWDFLIDHHSRMTGNSFTNWNKITPRHQSFIEKILRSPAHVIATMRVKQDYVLNQKDGKSVPEKVGLKAVQRDGVDYEFTIVFDLDVHHLCNCTKDRTEMFSGRPDFVISRETGEQIRDWCRQGDPLDSVRQQVLDAKSINELTDLYRQYHSLYDQLEPDFKQRKNELLTLQNSVQNGNARSSI